ncbi:MAG TPA: bifunctional riboflavin kinase/FAD synthetase [Burkholderiales bacterium]|nr:bifunctional riboflavin kinase/FAD synthetase [Burkholderiales bacterium]
MQVTHGTIKPEGGSVGLTIGNFDGVHRGHHAMLARVVARARELGLWSCVLTFEPHPREFFAPSAAPTRLTRLREKLELIAETGIDRVHILRFDAWLAALDAARFFEEVLLRGLGTRWLLVGRDFRFGARRAGDFALLEAAATRLGFGLEAMPEVMNEGERVSSSGVRAALAAGDLGGAARLLGREYTMSGRVAHGEKLGRSLGFATANIVLRRRPPLAGVFVVEAELEETHRVLRGVASVGRRPTVKDNAAPLLEVHLFDWSEDIYGRHLRVKFLAKLRDEEKYDGLEALRSAIRQDVAQARNHFNRKRNG